MNQGMVLESWKEIASHLKRSVATCQRWEIELELPVHRLDGTPRARVFAYADELDRWMAEKLHHSDAALEAPEEPHRRKNKRLVVVAGAIIAFAAIAILAWGLFLRKAQPTNKPDLAVLSKPGPVAQDRDIDLGRLTTSSPEALKYYIEGCKLMLGPLDDDGWRKARSLFSKAVEIDPEFAMAYSTLASTYGSKEEQTKNLTKALELSDRVSLRERLMIQGNYNSTIEKKNEEAIRAYRKSLKIYPNDDYANEKIATLYSRIKDFESAFKHREFLYKRNKASRFQAQQFVNICRALGYYDIGIEAYTYYLDQAPEDHEMRRRLYDWYWQCGKYELALNEADRLRAAGADSHIEKIFPLYLMGNYGAAEQLCKDYLRRGVGGWASRDWLQNIYITQGQLEKAKEQAILGLQEEEEAVKSGRVTECHGRCCLHISLASLYSIEGKLENALGEAEKAWTVARDFKHEYYQISALMAKAEIYLEMKMFDKAQEMAEEIGELIKSLESPMEMRNYHFISGKIELKKGNLPKAIDLFKRAQALEPPYYSDPYRRNPDYIATLASAYYQAGNLRSAKKECEKIPLIIEGRQLKGYVYAMNFYLLGKICDEQRDRAKAIEYFNKFLDLWKNADPVFTEVEDAKTRLARLVAH